MKLGLGIVDERVNAIAAKIQAYASRKDLNEEQKEDVRDLQREHEQLQRLKAIFAKKP